MGGALPRMAPMELRREDRVRPETCKMLLESDAFMHAQRTLKRELWCARVAAVALLLLLLLLLCSVFCLLFFLQLNPAWKDRGSSAKPNGDMPPNTGAQVGACEEKPAHPHSAFLKIHCSRKLPSGLGNMTWDAKQDLVGFTLDEDRQSLVVPADGVYRILLQVTYRKRSSEFCKESVRLFHQLNMYSSGYPRAIAILDVEEIFSCSDNYWKKTLYSGNVFNLRTGDKLKVESNDLGLIDCSGKVETKTFLSAHYESTG